MSVSTVNVMKSVNGGTFQPNTYLTNLSLAAFQSEDDYAATIAIQQIIANSRRNGTSLHSPAE